MPSTIACNGTTRAVRKNKVQNVTAHTRQFAVSQLALKCYATIMQMLTVNFFSTQKSECQYRYASVHHTYVVQ
jgi:hypothetical protein